MELTEAERLTAGMLGSIDPKKVAVLCDFIQKAIIEREETRADTVMAMVVVLHSIFHDQKWDPPLSAANAATMVYDLLILAAEQPAS